MNDRPTPPPPFGRFFLPGPTEVRPEVLRAQVGPMVGHRGPAVEGLMERLQAGLQPVFRTARPVFVSTSSATGLMEAAVRNGVRRRALALVGGAFGERFADIVEACGMEVERLEVPWGRPHDPDDVRRRLGGGGFDAVTVVHSETSTGVLQPLEAIAGAVREQDDVLLLVDAVTSMGGAPVLTDEWSLDFVLTGSQKALALPPGLAFAAASERMMARAREAPSRGVYFDLVAFEKSLLRHQTPNTPAVSLLYAAEFQLGRILDEGVEERWKRHRALAERCWAWVRDVREARGVDVHVLAPEGHRSPTVTCVRLPPDIPGTGVVEALGERGWTIAGGYGKMKDESCRVGHMGDHDLAELDALLEALEEVLVEVRSSRGRERA